MNLNDVIARQIMGDIENGLDFLMSSSTRTAVKAAGESVIDIELLRNVLRDLPPEPYAELMKSHGRPHIDGWTLIIPEERRFGMDLPQYVRASPYITAPVFIRTGSQMI